MKRILFNITRLKHVCMWQHAESYICLFFFDMKNTGIHMSQSKLVENASAAVMIAQQERRVMHVLIYKFE